MFEASCLALQPLIGRTRAQQRDVSCIPWSTKPGHQQTLARTSCRVLKPLIDSTQTTHKVPKTCHALPPYQQDPVIIHSRAPFIPVSRSHVLQHRSFHCWLRLNSAQPHLSSMLLLMNNNSTISTQDSRLNHTLTSLLLRQHNNSQRRNHSGTVPSSGSSRT